MKRVGENHTVFTTQAYKLFAEELLTGLTLKNLSL